jgi:hypothetical protein
MKIYLIKDAGVLKPADEQAEEALKKLKSGIAISCEIKRPRNYENHKRFFSLLQLVVDNQDKFKTVEELKEALKFELGWVETFRDMKGNYFQRPKSISFASMPENEFREFFDGSIDVILKYILPGTDREDLINEVLNYS